MSEPSTNGFRRMPRTVDDPAQVFFWAIDELIVVLVLVGGGIFSGKLMWCLLAAFLWTRLYRRFREGRPDGFLQHYLYWYGLGGPKRPTVPNPFIRSFYS